MQQSEFNDYLLGFDNSWLSFPFGEEISAYKTGDQANDEGKLFALIVNNSQPLKISLRCDPQLAKNLRAKYESVLPGENLSKKHWNTIICSGQLSDDEIKDLARHSYILASQSD